MPWMRSLHIPFSRSFFHSLKRWTAKLYLNGGWEATQNGKQMIFISWRRFINTLEVNANERQQQQHKNTRKKKLNKRIKHPNLMKSKKQRREWKYYKSSWKYWENQACTHAHKQQNKEITNSKHQPECKPWMDFIWFCKRKVESGTLTHSIAQRTASERKKNALNLCRMWRNINIYSITSITIEQYQTDAKKMDLFVFIILIFFRLARTQSLCVSVCAQFSGKNVIKISYLCEHGDRGGCGSSGVGCSSSRKPLR